MKERGLLFTGPMVRALQAGRKTQTRRVVKWIPGARGEGRLVRLPRQGSCVYLDFDGVPGLGWRPVGSGPTEPWPAKRIGEACPYGGPGGRLWVRETWAGDDMCGVVYRADHPDADIRNGDLDDGEQQLRRWRPSIFMPRWASRITLEITEVRVQRVQDITEEDVKAEGVRVVGGCAFGKMLGVDIGGDWLGMQEGDDPSAYPKAFASLWDTINAKRGYPWEGNPWVWAITFKVIP